MKFSEYIKNPTKDNLIKFKKYQAEKLKKNIENNGDNGYGYKKIQVEQLEEDIERLENENQGIDTK